MRTWEFERVASVSDFQEMVRGRQHWYHLLEDLFGYLRRDVLIAGNVTFSTRPQPAKEGTPTFEKVVGRSPVNWIPTKLGAEPPKPAPISRKAQRALAFLTQATFEMQARRGARPTAAPAPTTAPPAPPTTG